MLIQPLMKGLAPFESRAGDTYLGNVVTPNGAHVGTTGITYYTCLPERIGGDHQALLPHDNGALLAVQLPFAGEELQLQLSNHHRGGI
jgi:hypothetical protein